MKFKHIFIALFMIVINLSSVFAANEVSTNFSVMVPEYLNIQTLTSPLLTAHITDKTGTLYTPLFCKFRVVSNSAETKTLYLKSEAVTESGNEDSMFEMGGRIYVAFTYVNKHPRSIDLANCKRGSGYKENPGVVAYPINSVLGTKAEYSREINRYKVCVKNGTTDISVNLGSHVLSNSFGKNDPKGFYQATISLTESAI